jgi:hypothetical protein
MTFRTAGALVQLRTIGALQEKQIAPDVRAVRVVVTGLTALMALRNDVV